MAHSSLPFLSSINQLHFMPGISCEGNAGNRMLLEKWVDTRISLTRAREVGSYLSSVEAIERGEDVPLFTSVAAGFSTAAEPNEQQKATGAVGGADSRRMDHARNLAA